MKRVFGRLLCTSALLVAALSASLAAQTPSKLPAAPEGFDKAREGVEHGKLETVEYDSKTVGIKRKMVIYTPPGYSKDRKYPVFYLLHGGGDNETGWTSLKKGRAAIILDNLCADKKVEPMIVVMPNGFARKPGEKFEKGKGKGKGGKGFGQLISAFENDLLKDIIPYVEAHYPVRAGAAHRAIAGLSMGGGQALRIGLKHTDHFAWIGGWSSALFGQQTDLVPDRASRKNLRLLWVSCGDKDRLLKGSEAFHTALEEQKVPHIWHVDAEAHTWPVWRNDLYLFAQLLFRDGKGAP